MTGWPKPRTSWTRTAPRSTKVWPSWTTPAQLDSSKSQLNTQKSNITQQLRDAITQLDDQIPTLEQKIADLKGQLDKANQQLGSLKTDPSSLPEVTLPIDDALFASCKQILAQYDSEYNAAALPANLEEAKSDLNKMAAMIASHRPRRCRHPRPLPRR